MATSLFRYNSGSFSDPLSYTKVTLPSACQGGNKPCIIFAEVQLVGGVQRPIITPALSTEITTATSSGVPSANVELCI